MNGNLLAFLLACTALAEDLLLLEMVSEYLLGLSEDAPLPAEAYEGSVVSSSCSNITSESLLDTSVLKMLVSDALESIDLCPMMSERRQDEELDRLVMESRESLPTSMELVLDVAKSEYLDEVMLATEGRDVLEIFVIDESSSSSSDGYSGSGDGVGLSETSWLVGSGVGVGEGVAFRLGGPGEWLASMLFGGSSLAKVGVGLKLRNNVHSNSNNVSILIVSTSHGFCRCVTKQSALLKIASTHKSNLTSSRSATCHPPVLNGTRVPTTAAPFRISALDTLDSYNTWACSRMTSMNPKFYCQYLHGYKVMLTASQSTKFRFYVRVYQYLLAH